MRVARVVQALLLVAVLVGCDPGPVLSNSPVLERKTGTVLEKRMHVSHDAWDGTKKFCQLLIELEGGQRISIDGDWTAGAAPYELCELIREGEKVYLVKYQTYGWYLAGAKH